MNEIDLSIIVACYNVQDYLNECLDSISATTFPSQHMEVLMVDDGSSDNTSNIVDNYANKYSSFKALHKKNGGLSDARNYGMKYSQGQYVAFVDGDDIVPADAYTNLMFTAEVHSSDIVSGFVRRFDNLRDHPSYLHKFAIKDNEYNTNISKSYNLLYDTTAWNKVFRKQFLIDNNLKFIPNILYEDLPFSLKAHLKSKNTSVIKDVVYQWRWRPNSITQSRNALSNYISRINSLNICRNELLKMNYTSKDNLFLEFERKVLTIDLPIFLQNIGNAEEYYINKVQEITYCFLRDWNLLNSDYLSQLPIKQQIQYYAIKIGNLELLKKYSYIKNIGKFKFSKITHHYHYLIPDLDTKILHHIDAKHNNLNTTQNINRFKIKKNSNVIYGNGMFRIKDLPLSKKIFSTSNSCEKLSAELININNHKNIPISFNRLKTPLYKRILKNNSLWTNSRYKFSFNYKEAAEVLGLGNWMIKIKNVIDDKYLVFDYLSSPMKKTLNSFKPIELDDISINSDFNTNNQLIFKVRPLDLIGAKNTNWIKNPVLIDNHILQFETGLVVPNETTPIIDFGSNYLKGNINKENNQYKIEFDLNNWNQYYLGELFSIRLLHSQTNRVVPYLHQTNQNNYSKIINNKRLLVSYNNKKEIQINLDYVPAIISQCNILQGYILHLNSKLLLKVGNDRINTSNIKIEMINGNKQHRYILTPSNNNIILKGSNLSFDVPLLNNRKDQLLILAGSYHFKLYLPIDDDVKQISLLGNNINDNYHQLKFDGPDIVKYGARTTKNGNFRFRVKQPQFGFMNRKKSHRAVTYSVLYPLMRLLPLKKVMVFDSYWATKFDSNEKAMYQYMKKYHPEIKTVWFFHNRQTPINPKGNRVKVGTLKYWYYLAIAKYLIQNTNFPNQYLKRPRQIEVETLHGTFLKHMGFDEPHFHQANNKIQNRFAKRIRRWDYLVVPSQYMKNVASNAFDYHQKLLPYGFPRNDELINNNNENYIINIKNRLGIPLNKKVILYAPTFRDNQEFDFQLNLDKMQDNLSNDYVLLVRLHYFVAHTHSFYNNPNFVYDVSDYNNINDLFLISNVLVTDYSSVMFDYAYLKRPMIFYAYDKEWYLNGENRGVYLDYDKEIPGPIVKTEDELINQLYNLNNVKRKYNDKINLFHDKFAEYGNKGDATKNVVETILKTKDSELDQETKKSTIFNKFWHLFRIHDLQSDLLNYLGRVLPKRNIIMFESFFGTQFSDNPKAIYLYIKKYYPKYKLYWNVNEDYVDYFKQHHIPYIKRFGYRRIFKQAQAKYWITNARRPFRWDVPKNTTLLQTWHGTPLKTIGTDVNLVTMPGNNVPKYHRQVYNDAKRWDYLLAPNDYSSNIMQRAFRMNANQMMLTGYPRNDILINYNQEDVNNLKDRLNINHDKKIILYAPTWRDDEYIKNNEYTAKLHLDLEKFRQHYGNDIVVLIRTHYMIANQLDLSNYSDIAINVSSYQDIAQLYLISDVLITDYSSVMFDYAVLKRPIIFFDYDLNKYANDTRGFYFNFEKESPGKIVQNNNQLIDELDKILHHHWYMNDNYKKFVKKYANWMDGKATKRVVEELFNKNNVFESYSQNLDYFGLSSFVHIKDGALMWSPKKDFKNRFDVHFVNNYDQNNKWFKVNKIMQLKSTYFNDSLGMKYVLLKDKHNNQVWVNMNDIV